MSAAACSRDRSERPPLERHAVQLHDHAHRALRFKNGHFLMVGLEVEGRPAAARLQRGQPTLRGAPRVLQHQGAERPADLAPAAPQAGRPDAGGQEADRHAGDEQRAARASACTCLSTGTGLAPFMSIIRDPETYERFEHVIVAHGVRYVSELGYSDYIQQRAARSTSSSASRCRSSCATTRRSRASRSRTGSPHRTLLDQRQALRRPRLARARPRARPRHDLRQPEHARTRWWMLEARGFREGPSHEPAEYTIERAFVER